MSEYNVNPQSTAEEVISAGFNARLKDVDSTVARLHLENRIKNRPRQPRVRNWIKAAAFLTALVVLGGWATTWQLPSYDDAQQITVQMPDSFVPASYPHWVAILANHSTSLQDAGGHSLVVDYIEGSDGKYYLQLGIVGIGYSEANSWIRGVMEAEPELGRVAYSITQPLLPYRVTVKDMIAFKLGDTEAVERNIARAWIEAGESPKHLYLIQRPKEYAERVSNYLY